MTHKIDRFNIYLRNLRWTKLYQTRKIPRIIYMYIYYVCYIIYIYLYKNMVHRCENWLDVKKEWQIRYKILYTAFSGEKKWTINW